MEMLGRQLRRLRVLIGMLRDLKMTRSILFREIQTCNIIITHTKINIIRNLNFKIIKDNIQQSTQTRSLRLNSRTNISKTIDDNDILDINKSINNENFDVASQPRHEEDKKERKRFYFGFWTSAV